MADMKVQEKFHLDLNEEEASQHFNNLINLSVNSVYAEMIERIHRIVT